jgi:hypothetical protein
VYDKAGVTRPGQDPSGGRDGLGLASYGPDGERRPPVAVRSAAAGRRRTFHVPPSCETPSGRRSPRSVDTEERLPRHDPLFKRLLATFFPDFLDLFAPALARQIEPGSLELLDKETLDDLAGGGATWSTCWLG